MLLENFSLYRNMKKIFIYLTILSLVVIIKANQEKKLAVFWGSNPDSGEHRLRDYCDRETYDTVIITTLTSNSKVTNKNDLPSLNFANHCNDNPLKGYNVYLKCPEIEDDIAHCQTKGIKVLLDIGGSSIWIGFSSTVEAEQFAEQIWNLFLGGKTDYPRSFGSVILDGINLSMQNSQRVYQVDFVRKLRQFMDKSRLKFSLTASPICEVETNVLKKAFKDLASAFDQLYVDFAHPVCSLNDTGAFKSSLQEWLKYAQQVNGPQIYIGLSASDRIQNETNFVVPDVLNTVFQDVLLRNPHVGGIILNNANYDDKKIFSNGKRYSEITKLILTEKYKQLHATDTTIIRKTSIFNQTPKIKNPITKKWNGKKIVIIVTPSKRKEKKKEATILKTIIYVDGGGASIGPSKTFLFFIILVTSMLLLRY